MKLLPEAALQVLDSMTEGVSVCDEHGVIVYTNPAEDRMFGYERGGLIGRHVTTLNAYDPAENQRLVGTVIGKLRTEGVWTGEWRNLRKDGTEFTTDSRITATLIDGAPFWVCVQDDVTEARAAERKLRESEERCRSLVEQAADGIFVANTAGRYVEVNDAACAMLGYSREELLQLSIADVIPPSDLERLAELRTHMIQTGATESGEWLMRRKDGKYIAGELSTKIFTDGRWQAIVRDASERKRAEDERRALIKTLETLIDSSPLPIVTLATTGEITLWNPAAERLFGWTASEVLGKPIPFVPQDKLAEHRGMRAEDLSGQKQTRRTIRRLRKDGTPIDLLVSTAPFYDDHGQVTGILSLYVDVTEQRRALAALAESEARFRNMADTAPVMIWIADPDHQCTWFNAGWLTFRGRTMEQDAGTGWLDGVHPEDREQCWKVFSESIDTRSSFQTEFRLRTHNGPYHWVIDSGIPRFSESGDYLGHIGSCIDINDRKGVEQEREAALAALARINEELKQFNYVASHDLQEPLRTVTTYSQLLTRRYVDKLDDDGRDFARFIIDAAQRMSDLILGVLAFSHISSEPVEMTDVDLADCVRKAIGNLRDTLTAAGADIVVDGLPGVRANASQLIRLFENLIANSVQYARDGSVQIRISAEREAGEWVFSVSDKGIGIEPEFHDQIFGLFKRLHGFELPGTGLGLAICKKVVENHHGRIWVDSTPGNGATFRFTLGTERVGHDIVAR